MKTALPQSAAAKRRYSAGIAIVLGVVLFFAVNIVSNIWLSNARIDLTQNGLYTLSDGTKATLKKLEEPIHFKFYYSRNTAADYAAVAAYAARVRDLLQEYVARSGGKITLEEVNPEPFSAAEDEATEQGLTAAPTETGENVYLGLVATNSLDGREVIPFFTEDREQYLEYDLTSAIYRLSTPEKPKLGVMAGIPLEAGAGGPQAALSGQSAPFVAFAQLSSVFSVVPVSAGADRIPANITTLMLVHPATMTDSARYAVDQFVMRGGHLLVFVDPLSEVLSNQAALPAQTPTSTASTLQPMLQAWGVSYDASKILGDAGRAQQVRVGGSAQQVSDYIAWLKLTKDDFDAKDPVTANLAQLNLASAGALAPIAGATTHFLPLVQSSEDSALLNTGLVHNAVQPQDLLAGFKAGGKKLTIAARITGPAKSAYAKQPDILPPLPEETAAPVAPVGPLPAHIAEAKDINVIVMADTDIFDDRFWVRQGQNGNTPIADNGAFILNAVENLMGSNELLSLRTRASGTRTFTVVENLRREAETQYLAEERQLQQRLAQTQSRLRQLQSGESETGAPSNAPGEEQRQEIDRFRRDLTETRTALRQVQANLRESVQSLGDWLAFLNTALVPLLVAIAAVVLAVLRRRRRMRARNL